MKQTAIDICSNRHHGNAQSVIANDKNRHGRKDQRTDVLAIITRWGGATMKEVAAEMDVALNTVSGRGSELKRLGMIERTGEVRNGSAVLRATGRISLAFPPKPARRNGRNSIADGY